MADKKLEIATFGGGCFWCTEAVFQQVRGVTSVVSGYAGGTPPAGGERPTYENVSSGSTGHAEVTQITFDPAVVMYRDLLEVFFATHDPTTMNRQGNDVGTQYRSVILYSDVVQKNEAEKVIQELTEQDAYGRPIVTQIKALDTFYPAEQYHQNYYNDNTDQGYCQFVIAPKLAKFKKKFASLVKDEKE